MTAAQPSPDHDAHGHTHDDEPPRAGAHGARLDPWAVFLPSADDPPRERRAWRREAADALLVALPVTVLTGLTLGLLWLWLSPRIPLVYDGDAVLLNDSEGEQAIGADGTFLLLGLGIGALAGGVVFLLRRRGGVGVVLGLAAGSLLGSLLAFRLGVWLGPTEDLAARAREVGKNVVFDAPLDLDAHGVLLGLPIAALAVHLLCSWAWGPQDPEHPPPAEFPRWGARTGSQGGTGSSSG